MIKVGYLSECDKDYAAGLKKSQSFNSLVAFIARWRFLANDAYKSVNSTKFNWDEFVSGRAMENKDQYCGRRMDQEVWRDYDARNAYACVDLCNRVWRAVGCYLHSAA